MLLQAISLLGLGALIALAWGLSVDRARFPWRTVISGLGLQLAFAVPILKTAPGAALFDFANRAVAKFISFADEGAKMVFGPLADTAVLISIPVTQMCAGG